MVELTFEAGKPLIRVHADGRTVPFSLAGLACHFSCLKVEAFGVEFHPDIPLSRQTQILDEAAVRCRVSMLNGPQENRY